MHHSARQLRIGLSMRQTSSEHGEIRDALAVDWNAFLQDILPEAAWTPVPNLEGNVVDFLRHWEINGLILTGGEDPGSSPQRDATEAAMLDFARERTLPVLGVCRGLQFMQFHFGGSLSSCEQYGHVGRRHSVSIPHSLNGLLAGTPGNIEVNSYHKLCVHADQLVPALQPLALADGNVVEGVVDREGRMAAVQWHPEREHPFRDHDRQLVRRLFFTEDEA